MKCNIVMEGDVSLQQDNIDVLEFKIVPVYERYYNEDTSWGVFNFTTQDDIPEYSEYKEPMQDLFSEARIQKMSSLCGKMQQLYIGSEYLVKAYCEYNSKYNQYQYVPISIVAIAPQSYEDQKVFLKSLTSESIAENILQEYPNVVEEVMNGKLVDLEYDKIRGVGKATWERVRKSIIDNYVVSEIITLLQPLGVTYNIIKKLLSFESNPSLLKEKLMNNPYMMTNIRGLGFKRVDDLSLKLKPELKHSLQRLTAYIMYYLRTIGDNEGHTWVTLSQLKNNVSDNVVDCYDLLDELLEHNLFLYKEDDKIGLKEYRDVESRIFQILIDKQNEENTKINIDDIERINQCITNVEKDQGFEYTEEQKSVILKALNNNLTIISGKAGTGKTSITRGILKIYQDFNYSISACALSAKAAQRIQEATGFKASTIHRLLGAQGLKEFTYNYNNPLPTDVILVDEASMINAQLFLDLLQAVDLNTRIIVCGDHMQLPPIGYGNVFSDILHRKEFQTFQLTKPMRQAQLSGILSDANLIREGISPISSPEPKMIRGTLKDMYYMFREDRDTLNKIAINTYLASVKTDGVDEVVIVTPRRKDCTNSSTEINKIIQEKLLGDVNKSIKSSIREFKLGAKVMQIINNYDKHVFNGEIGYITNIGEKTEGNKKVQYCEVEYDNPVENVESNKKIIEYKSNELNELELAYALTTHKIQGSGVNTVIGIIDNTHYTLLDNCMLYTLITRAKKRCCLLAEPSAFIRCIKTNHNTSRQTWISLDESIK